MNLKITRTRKYVRHALGYWGVKKYLYTCIDPSTRVALFRYAFSYREAAEIFTRAINQKRFKSKVVEHIDMALDTLLGGNNILTNIKT
jgi:hypothetical protein